MESEKVLGLVFPFIHPLTPNQTSGFCRIILTPSCMCGRHEEKKKKKKKERSGRVGWPSFLLKGVGSLPVRSDEE